MSISKCLFMEIEWAYMDPICADNHITFNAGSVLESNDRSARVKFDRLCASHQLHRTTSVNWGYCGVLQLCVEVDSVSKQCFLAVLDETRSGSHFTPRGLTCCQILPTAAKSLTLTLSPVLLYSVKQWSWDQKIISRNAGGYHELLPI